MFNFRTQLWHMRIQSITSYFLLKDNILFFITHYFILNEVFDKK